ncbi:MAG TPA: acyl-CoA synthetase, partial [Myxococcota bacterium]|nr:acyl-CoA synthetase [Myxococcota bacterium]
DLAGHESGQDHVALALYNSNEYFEGMLGSYRARAAPFNVNYRYVEEELRYLFENADARAVIYHARFAPTLAKIRRELPKLELFLQVADDSGEALLDGAQDYEQALANATPDPTHDLSPEDLYILYTGGTTGMPKGVLWRQADIYAAALAGLQPRRSVEEIVARAKEPPMRVLPAPPFMHGAAHWAAFSFWHVGGTVVVQAQTRHLDADDIWSTIERERVDVLTIVGDAFGRPLLDQLERKSYDLSSLKLLTSGGAILTAVLKQHFLERLPGLRILDALGSSESGAQAAQVSERGGKATTGDFAVAAGNLVLREDLSGVLTAGSGERGWLAREGVIPLGYYKDEEKTRKTFPVIGSKRYVVPGDRATIEADGTMRLLGRDSVTINTGGEKVFAEEVEQALKHHPSVYDAVVVGTPHERFGQQVTAVVKLRTGATASPDELRQAAGEHLAHYKLPRTFVFVDEIVRSPSGKADYRWARERATQERGV